MCMCRNRDQPWSYRYGDLTPSRPDQFGNPSLAGEPMIRLERVPAQSGFWRRERLQVVRTFPITPFFCPELVFGREYCEKFGVRKQVECAALAADRTCPAGYSEFRAAIGSRLAARRAGRETAGAALASRIRTAVPSMTGSRGRTP